MPTKVLLSQLRTSFTFTMKPLSSRPPLPIFSRILFPFNLKHLALQNPPLPLRPLSTRAHRDISSGSNSSRGKVRASKSLIDEESELSGWVSELRTDSYRGRVTSDDDDNRDSDRGRGTMGMGRGRGRGGGRGGRIGESTRRETRDSFDSDSYRGRGNGRGRGRGGRGRDIGGESTRRGTRDSFDSDSYRGRGNGRGSGR